MRAGLREKTGQALVHKAFLILCIAIPMYDLVAESFTAPAYTVANTRRTHADAGCLNRLKLNLFGIGSGHSAEV